MISTTKHYIKTPFPPLLTETTINLSLFWLIRAMCDTLGLTDIIPGDYIKRKKKGYKLGLHFKKDKVKFVKYHRTFLVNLTF